MKSPYKNCEALDEREKAYDEQLKIASRYIERTQTPKSDFWFYIAFGFVFVALGSVILITVT